MSQNLFGIERFEACSSRVQTGEIDVRVKWVSTGEQFVVKCGPQDTIGHLKDLIQDKTGIPPNNQKLIHHDETLSDYNKLSDYGIGNNSAVKLYEKNFSGGSKKC